MLPAREVNEEGAIDSVEETKVCSSRLQYLISYLYAHRNQVGFRSERLLEGEVAMYLLYNGFCVGLIVCGC
jgi:hypothetical protein